MVDDIRPQPKKPADDGNKKGIEEQFPGIKPDPQEGLTGISLIKNDSGSVQAASPRHKYQPPKKNKKTPPKSWKEKFFSRGLEVWPHSEKQKKLGIAIIAVLLIFGSITAYALNKIANRPYEITASYVVFKPKTSEPSRLTGVEIPIKLNKRHVTSVMIENSPDARPQSGLYNAGVVFEAIAEGGITRFNALYLEDRPGYIGPIRSVRPYYVDLMLPFDAAFVHAGGSGDGLAKVARLKVKDIDHGANAAAFQRISSRFAPHNLYSSMDALDKVSKRRGYKKSTFESWPRHKKESPAEKVNAGNINFSISGPLYDVRYDYDKNSNSYKRIMAGRPHVDEKAKKQIKPKVVIALIMKYHNNGIYSVYKTTGSGDMFVFQNGTVTKGTWNKSGSKSQFKFTDKEGEPILLNPGQTWVTLLKNSGEVKFSP
ncbi:MAG TPA: DUF3048 domain-containing protein [Candidatus Saccharimonadales bacterium]|nr:DUF3048 domain-containing protein [Candidatus Saccharimonadales bacterium]